MRAHQLIQAIGPELQNQITSYIQTEHRAAYRSVMESLAAQRKLRPVFLQRKTKEQQAAWLLDQLRLKSNDAVAEQIIQLWLLKGQPKMLTTFLDAAGIKHDGNGEVEDLPEKIESTNARAAVEALLKDFPPRQVALYLEMFQRQREGGWPELAEAMSGHPEIQLAPPA